MSQFGSVSVDELRGKVIGIYFGYAFCFGLDIMARANWYTPCNVFTQQLRKVYHNLQSKGRPFEVVFVSSDNDMQEFEDSYTFMPWLAVPYERDDILRSLRARFNVTSIPTLLFLDEYSGVYNANGRLAINLNPTGYPWKE